MARLYEIIESPEFQRTIIRVPDHRSWWSTPGPARVAIFAATLVVDALLVTVVMKYILPALLR